MSTESLVPTEASTADDTLTFALKTDDLQTALLAFGPLPPKANHGHSFLSNEKARQRHSAARARTSKIRETWAQKAARPLTMTISCNHIDFGALLETKAKIKGFVTTSISICHVDIDAGSNTIIVNLVPLQLYSTLAPGALIEFQYSKSQQELRIRQGESRIILSLMNTSPDLRQDTFSYTPIDVKSINTDALLRALTYVSSLARADRRREGTSIKKVDVYSGVALGGGNDLLACFESPHLSEVGLTMPLTAIGIVGHFLRQLDASSARCGSDASYIVIQDQTRSLVIERLERAISRSDSVTQRQASTSIVLSRESLDRALTTLKIVRYHVERNKTLMKRLAILVAQATAKDSANSAGEKHDGERVRVLLSLGGDAPSLSLSIEDPLGKAKGNTGFLPCQISGPEGVEADKNIEVWVDLVYWLRAVNAVDAHDCKVSIIRQNNNPLLLVVESAGNQTNRVVSIERARCFISLMPKVRKK